MQKIIHLTLGVSIMVLLSACGQKGGLYLPDQEPASTEKSCACSTIEQ